MSKKWLTAKVWKYAFVAVAVAGLLVYLVLGRSVQTSASGRLVQSEETLARAQSASISSFFADYGESLAVFAQLSSVEQFNDSTARDMDTFVDQWRESGLIGGIILTDNKGVVRFNSNIQRQPNIGVSISDLDYFSWATSQEEEGNYFIGKSTVGRLGASAGQVIIPVASPVYAGSKFVGVLASSVRLAPLTERFLNKLMVSEDTRVYLVNSDRKILYNSSDPASVDLEFNLLGDNLEKYFNNGTGGVKIKKDYLVYSPLSLGQNHWLLVMVSPSSGISNLARPIYVREVAILAAVWLMILLFAAISLPAKKAKKRKKSPKKR